MGHLSFLVVVFHLFVASCYSIKFVDVDTICKNATNPSFCSTLLKSNPSGSGDLINLAQYTLNVVRTNVTNTIKQINKLIRQSVGYEAAWIHYRSCLTDFSEDIGALQFVDGAEGFLKVGNYALALDCTISIEGRMYMCMSGGNSPSDPPFHDTSSLPKYVYMVNQISEIIETILNYLVKT